MLEVGQHHGVALRVLGLHALHHLRGVMAVDERVLARQLGRAAKPKRELRQALL